MKNRAKFCCRATLFTPFLFSHSVMMFRSFRFQKIRRETQYVEVLQLCSGWVVRDSSIPQLCPSSASSTRRSASFIMPFSSNRKQWARLQGVNMFDGQEYHIEMVPNGRQDKVVPESLRTVQPVGREPTRPRGEGAQPSLRSRALSLVDVCSPDHRRQERANPTLCTAWRYCTKLISK